MSNSNNLSRRKVLKFIIFSSTLFVFSLFPSCKNKSIEPLKQTFETSLDMEIAKMEKIVLKKTKNGYFKIPNDFVYRPKQEAYFVLISKRSSNGSSFSLEMRKIKTMTKNDGYILSYDSLENVNLLIDPQYTINKLNKIDHNTLKQRFTRSIKSQLLVP